MSDSRAQTLASLDAFLEAQRQLLARTQTDLHKLSQLRERALENPEEFLDSIEGELDDPAFKMSQYEHSQRPRDIDWDLFASLDPSPFSNIALPGPPPLSAATKQRSEPSEIQKFVREASKTILANFKPFVPDEEEEVAEVDADAAEDEQRLAELVKSGRDAKQPAQMIELDVEGPQLRRRRVGSGLRLKPSHEAIASECGADASTKGKGSLSRQKGRHIDNDSQSTPSVPQRPKRTRRPTARLDESSKVPPPSTPSQLDLPPLPDALCGDDVPVPTGHAKDMTESDSNASVASDEGLSHHSRVKKKAKRGESRRRKVASDTFNLPWSLSEQHLLEKLLEEIPAGEKQRWAKISKAMAGRRTARQVASRVQKYYEKLKKFGVDPD